MSKSVYKPQTWEPMPRGMHTMTLRSVRDEMSKGLNNWEPAPQKKLLWESDTVGLNGGSLRIPQWANDSFAPKSKLRAIATALNDGRDPGDAIDWDDYVGRRAQVIVKHVTDERSGRTWVRVTEVLRLPTATEEEEAARATRHPHPEKAPGPDATGVTDPDIPF
jgi:hypothetical protein